MARACESGMPGGDVIGATEGAWPASTEAPTAYGYYLAVSVSKKSSPLLPPPTYPTKLLGVGSP